MRKPLWIALMVFSLAICLSFLGLAALVLHGIAVDDREDAKAFHPPYAQSIQRVKEQPQSPYAHMGLGLSLYDKREYRHAIIEFKTALRLGAPTGYREHCRLYVARSYLALGNKAEARAELNEVLKLSPPTGKNTISVGSEAAELLSSCH